jgi:hypothetical protein
MMRLGRIWPRRRDKNGGGGEADKYRVQSRAKEPADFQKYIKQKILF